MSFHFILKFFFFNSATKSQMISIILYIWKVYFLQHSFYLILNFLVAKLTSVLMRICKSYEYFVILKGTFSSKQKETVLDYMQQNDKHYAIYFSSIFTMYTINSINSYIKSSSNNTCTVTRIIDEIVVFHFLLSW